MRRVSITAALALLLVGAVAAGAQSKDGKAPAAAPSIGQALDGQLKGAEGEFVSAAEAMPDATFDFAPTSGEFKGVRTFAQQVKHVAATNYLFYSAVAGEKPPADTGGESGPDALKSKDEIIKYLKDSYAYAHKVLTGTTAGRWMASVPAIFPGGPTTPLGVAVLQQGHMFDHYGQMVEYLRMNEIIPPASRPRPPAKK